MLIILRKTIQASHTSTERWLIVASEFLVVNRQYICKHIVMMQSFTSPRLKIAYAETKSKHVFRGRDPSIDSFVRLNGSSKLWWVTIISTSQNQCQGQLAIQMNFVTFLSWMKKNAHTHKLMKDRSCWIIFRFSTRSSMVFDSRITAKPNYNGTHTLWAAVWIPVSNGEERLREHCIA